VEDRALNLPTRWSLGAEISAPTTCRPVVALLVWDSARVKVCLVVFAVFGGRDLALAVTDDEDAGTRCGSVSRGGKGASERARPRMFFSCCCWLQIYRSTSNAPRTDVCVPKCARGTIDRRQPLLRWKAGFVFEGVIGSERGGRGRLWFDSGWMRGLFVFLGLVARLY